MFKWSIKIKNILKILEEFDSYLKKKKLSYSGIVIGGTALILLDISTRETKDVDILDPSIPLDIKEASMQFANSYKKEHIDPNWFNDMPRSLLQDLPSNWKKNTVPLFNGSNLKLVTLDRLNLLRAKLFAFCDRGIDLVDCLNMKPTAQELKKIYPWLKDRDGNSKWPKHVKISLKEIGKELGYELELE